MTHPDADAPQQSWTDFTAAQAAELKLNLAERTDITAPLNEAGEPCPWPWEPQQLVGAPLGQYHCGYCGAMVIAGAPHVDYRPEERTLTADNFDEVAEWCGGHPAISDHRALLIGGTDDTGAARYGDTIRRDGYGDFTIIPGGAA